MVCFGLYLIDDAEQKLGETAAGWDVGAANGRTPARDARWGLISRRSGAVHWGRACLGPRAQGDGQGIMLGVSGWTAIIVVCRGTRGVLDGLADGGWES